MISVCASISVMLCAVAVGVGWAADIDVLKRVFSGTVSMKPVTAAAFLITGGICLELSTLRRRVVIETLCYMTVVLFGFACAYSMAEHALAASTGVVDKGVDTVRPLEPSVMTMVSFSIFCVGAILSRVGIYPSARNAFAVVIAAGLFALIGYAVGVPEMYYYRPRVSTAMAVHTAVLLIVLGKIGIATSSRAFVAQLEESA